MSVRRITRSPVSSRINDRAPPRLGQTQPEILDAAFPGGSLKDPPHGIGPDLDVGIVQRPPGDPGRIEDAVRIDPDRASQVRIAGQRRAAGQMLHGNLRVRRMVKGMPRQVKPGAARGVIIAP